jgi:arabinofuranan 3-O-arabinosyltransferase
VQRDRFGGRFAVDGCPAGCWFTFGEGFNEAWSASIAGADLGPPTLIDGGFNGWWVMPTEASFEVEVAWTVQRPLTIAMILSGLAALACLVVALRGRRARDAPLTVTAFATDRRPLDRRQALVVGSVWAAAGLLLVGPEGLVLGVGGGLALVWSRRRDLPALAAISTVVAVAAYVVVNERRWSPMPDGGWPIQFERVHEIGVFAAVSLLVAAIAADDGDVDANRFDRRSPRLPSRP